MIHNKTLLFYLSFILALMLVFCVACRKDADPSVVSQPLTKNAVILVIDGPRWSETWGDTVDRIPFRRQLKKKGVFFSEFFNSGETHTTAGHTAMTTGFYQAIQNNGAELPAHPSIFQLFRKQYPVDSLKCWVITSKEKLAVLVNTTDPFYNNSYLGSADCGINGWGTGNRDDTTTLNHALQKLSQHHPKIALIQFKEPDVQAHAGNWAAYLQQIHNTDSMAGVIWNFLSNDPFYKDQTAFIITNDHGRHLDGILDGFRSHGDGCAGCRKIECLATGPDFKNNVEVADSFNQADIFTTLAFLLRVPVDSSQGRVMSEMFR